MRAYGPLLSDDGTTWLGMAVLVRAPDPNQARAVLTSDRYADIEVQLGAWRAAVMTPAVGELGRRWATWVGRLSRATR